MSLMRIDYLTGKVKQVSKKELRIRRNTEGLFEVYFEGGGQVPDCLTGLYNKYIYAGRAVATYKASKPKPKRSRRNDNGEDSDSKSRI